jgi:hypothetical protein
MRIVVPILLVVLLALPLHGGITSLVQKAGEEPGGCNAFSETTWDNLDGWTSSGGFTADSSNDELDYNTSGDSISNDTTTTNSNHCVLWQFKETDLDAVELGLRMPTSGNFYAIGWDYYYDEFYWSVYDTNGNWIGDNASAAGNTPDDGDYISACVTGTGTNTVITYWDHGGSNPGDCRSDWGAATITRDDDPDFVINSGTRVGILLDDWSGGGSGTLDEFVGSDY